MGGWLDTFVDGNNMLVIVREMPPSRAQISENTRPRRRDKVPAPSQQGDIVVQDPYCSGQRRTSTAVARNVQMGEGYRRKAFRNQSTLLVYNRVHPVPLGLFYFKPWGETLCGAIDVNCGLEEFVSSLSLVHRRICFAAKRQFEVRNVRLEW
jgi:hypothetical protein